MVLNKYFTWFIALVWLINGLFCKLLNLVPRHELIVARILGDEYSTLLTKAIGISEMFMAIWIFTQFKSRLSALATIALVAVMNTIEFILAKDLLLFGWVNSIVAILFIIFVYYNEFILNKHKTTI